MSVPSRHSRSEMTDFSMPDPQQAVIGGIEGHTDFGVAAALDPLGRVLGTESFPATCAGYRLTHRWLASFGPITTVGVESTGSFGAALTRSLVDQGCRVIEVNQPHPHLRSRRANNDAIDAEAAARKVLSGEATAAATDTTGIVEAIRQLSVTRNSAVKARAAASPSSATCSSPLPPRCATSSTPAGPSRAPPPCALGCGPTRTASPIPPRPPTQHCAASGAASPSSALRPPSSAPA